MSYILAQQSGQVRVNNEPMRWLSRRGPVSFAGQQFLIDQRFFSRPKESLDKGFLEFISKLNRPEVPTVSKFVSGSAFAHQINREMNPDMTIVIIRKVEDVLSSISGSSWDYFSLILPRLGNLDIMDQFMDSESVRMAMSEHMVDSASINTRVRTNALYWYLVNSHLLELSGENIYFIPFERIKFFSDVLKSKIMSCDTSIVSSIDNPMFYDSNLAGDYPLTGDAQSTATKIMSLINEVSFFSNVKFGLKLPYIELTSGSTAFVSTDESKLITHKTTNRDAIRVNISNDKMISKFQEDISERLNKKLHSQN